MEPQAVLYINQFNKNYEDLPFMEDAKELTDGGIYRSRQNGRLVYVWHREDNHWDSFVWSYY